MLLELKNICKSYPQGKQQVPILKDINLSVEEGEYVAIMGPSGSGKTTLMNIIGCLDRPSSGTYYLDGKDILKYKDRAMSVVRLNTIGFVFQSFYLMPKQTAVENVSMPLLYAGVPRRKRREIAASALEKVGLEERLNYKPSQLSGGQCQRVAIARAIANHPKILLADEPTGALDSKSGAQIMELFETLHKDGVTIIMITHDREIAEHAERIIRIRDGEISEEPWKKSMANAQVQEPLAEVIEEAAQEIAQAAETEVIQAAGKEKLPIEQAGTQEDAEQKLQEAIEQAVREAKEQVVDAAGVQEIRDAVTQAVETAVNQAVQTAVEQAVRTAAKRKAGADAAALNQAAVLDQEQNRVNTPGQKEESL